MPDASPLYDLMLLLSTSTPEERRAKIVHEVESAISSGGGSIERDDDWGTRRLAYRIGQRTDAEYHLLQFRGPAQLLDSLSHNLRIADEVVRFRIIKVLPGTPPVSDSPPPMVASATASAARSGGGAATGSGTPAGGASASAPEDAELA